MELIPTNIETLNHLDFHLYVGSLDLYSAPPPSIFGAIKTGQKSKLSKSSKEHISALGYYTIFNAKIHGLGLITLNNKLLYGEDIYCRQNMLTKEIIQTFKSDIHFSNNKPTTNHSFPEIVIDQPVILIAQRGIHIYGHWLLDILPKLYLIEKLGLTEVPILLPEEIPTYAYKLLNIFNLKNRIIFYNPDIQNVLCTNLIIPTHCRFGTNGSILHPIIGDFYKHKINQKGSSKRLVYLSRGKFKRTYRRLLNSKVVEDILKEFGFETIYPEHLTINEQIELMQETNILIGEFGSALHNSLFGSSEMNVLSLCGNHLINLVQHKVCQVRGQSCSYLFGESIFKKSNRINADYIINPAQLKISLKQLNIY